MKRVPVPSLRELRHHIKADIQANPRDPKAQTALAAFRFCQYLMKDLDSPRRISFVFIALYRMFTELVCGWELRPKTMVGAGLTIYHGYGLVVNDAATIGTNVIVRNGVVIGQKIIGGPSPTIGNNVEFGAGAIVLGDVTVGDRATIGAGAVVTQSIPEDSLAVGVPARIHAKSVR